MEARTGLADSRGRSDEIFGIVHRVVHAEDRYARLGGSVDEAANQILLDRLCADEEPTAQRHPERRLGGAPLQRADALPRTLDATFDGAIKAAPTRYLKDMETRAVKQLAGFELQRSRHASSNRFLRQKPQGSVNKTSHYGERLAALPSEWLGARHISAVTGVDLDHVTLIDKQWHLHHRTGFHRRGFHYIRHGIALDARLGSGDGELDRGR